MNDNTLNDFAEQFGDMPTGNDSKVLMELFSNQNIKTRTDLREREISIIARLEYYGKKTKNKNIAIILTSFMELKLSRDRLSRQEFIDAFKNKDKPKPNILESIKGMVR
jgi:hypothetical protein